MWENQFSLYRPIARVKWNLRALPLDSESNVFCFWSSKCKQTYKNPRFFSRMVACPICKVNLKTKYGYLQHYDSVHSMGQKKNYRCPFCPLSFRRNSFYTHIAQSHSNENFEQKEELEEAVKIEEIYCRHCSQTFNSIKNFELHVQNLEKGVTFPCPYCKRKNLASYDAYRMHKSR